MFSWRNTRDLFLLVFLVAWVVFASMYVQNLWLMSIVEGYLIISLYASRGKEIRQSRLVKWFRSTKVGTVWYSIYTRRIVMIVATGELIQVFTGANVWPTVFVCCAVLVAYMSLMEASRGLAEQKWDRLIQSLPDSTVGVAAMAVFLAMATSLDFSIDGNKIVFANDKIDQKNTRTHRSLLQIMIYAKTLSLYYEHGITQEQIDEVASVAISVIKSSSILWLLAIKITPDRMSETVRRFSYAMRDDVERVSRMIEPGKLLSASDLGVERESIKKIRL